MLTHPYVQPGDRARFPLESRQVGNPDAPTYRHSWEALGFTADGGVTCRRLADGLIKTVSTRVWYAHALTDRYQAYRRADAWRTAQRARVAAMRQRWPRPRGRYPYDPDTRPGPYYVSAHYDGRTVLLAGPYLTHADALSAVDAVRARAAKADPRACWYAYGTCRAKDGGDLRTVFGRVAA